MSNIKQAWKAVVAFFAPGLVLIGERVLLDGVALDDVSSETVKRALVTGAVTSALVYLKRNGVSNDPTTSTPEVAP